MEISSKAQKFAKRIFKYYPIPDNFGKQDDKCCSSHPTQPQMLPFAHMHDHRKQRQIYERPTQEKLDNMKYFKEMGNSKFKERNYQEASYFYHKTIIYADYTFPDKKQQIAEMELLTQQANINMAICLIKQDIWDKVDMYLRQAARIGMEIKQFPQIQSLSVSTRKKAYYWHCKYWIKKQNYQQADKMIVHLQQLQSQIATKQEIAELSKQIEGERSKYQKQTKQLSKKMFIS